MTPEYEAACLYKNLLADGYTIQSDAGERLCIIAPLFTDKKASRFSGQQGRAMKTIRECAKWAEGFELGMMLAGVSRERVF